MLNPKSTWLYDELESFVTQYLPALKSLEIQVEKADADSVILSAPLSANYNDKGTAFGGSQYVLALSSAWALTYLNMVNNNHKETQFVIAHANIDYLAPTTSERFFAMAKTPQEHMIKFVDRANSRDKGKVEVCAEIYNHDPRENAQNANSTLSATFALTGR